jgi:hypothetical protein
MQTRIEENAVDVGASQRERNALVQSAAAGGLSERRLAEWTGLTREDVGAIIRRGVG